LNELWDESQYSEEFDINSFLTKLKWFNSQNTQQKFIYLFIMNEL
jgi:hypothetical protein